MVAPGPGEPDARRTRESFETPERRRRRSEVREEPERVEEIEHEGTRPVHPNERDDD